uniref:Uncharacterized protein n=1 Tax=Arundo donax TaxID=35708 RepID=A0A0A9HCH9_ARUDO
MMQLKLQSNRSEI